MKPPRVHALLRVDPSVVRGWPGAPTWVPEALLRAPWVVVRRERIANDIPIGVRGDERTQRFAGCIAARDVLETIEPEGLDVRFAHNQKLVAVFASAREAAREDALHVAPIGSFGFELASGVRVTHAASDLDILVKDEGATRAALLRFAAALGRISAATGVRIDAEYSNAEGAAALDEVLARPALVLFKTPLGPKLLPCPL